MTRSNNWLQQNLKIRGVKRRLLSMAGAVAVAVGVAVAGVAAAGVATVVEDGAATEVAMADGADMAEVGAMDSDV